MRRTLKGAKILDRRTTGAEPLPLSLWTFWRLETGPFVCTFGPAMFGNERESCACVWRVAAIEA